MAPTSIRQKKVGSSSSRTYSRNNSRIGLAGSRPVDAMLRLCAQKLQQKRIRNVLNDSRSEDAENFHSPEQSGVSGRGAPAFSKDIFDFTSDSTNDDFDKLQKSGSFINPKYTAKKKQTRRPLRNRNVAPPVIESSSESIQATDDESVLEMFPARKKRKRKAKGNVQLADAPKPKRGRKKIESVVAAKKAPITADVASNNAVLRKKLIERSNRTESATPCPSRKPGGFSSPCFATATPGASTSSGLSAFGHLTGIKFHSTPLELRKVARKRALPPFVSSIKKQNTLSHLPSPMGSPVLSVKNALKPTPAVQPPFDVLNDGQIPSADSEAKRSAGSFYTCPTPSSSQSQEVFQSAQDGGSTQKDNAVRDSVTADLFADVAAPEIGVSFEGDVDVEAHDADVDCDGRVRSGFTMSIGFDDHFEEVPNLNASFPTHARALPLGDLTMGCVREMRARFIMQDVPEAVEEEEFEDQPADAENVQEAAYQPTEHLRTPSEVGESAPYHASFEDENNDDDGEETDLLFTASDMAGSTPRARRRTTSDLFSRTIRISDETDEGKTPVVAEAAGAEASVPSAIGAPNRELTLRVVLERLSISEGCQFSAGEVDMRRSRKHTSSDAGVGVRRSMRLSAATRSHSCDPVSSERGEKARPSKKKVASKIGVKNDSSPQTSSVKASDGASASAGAPSSPEIIRDSRRSNPYVLLENLNIVVEEAVKEPMTDELALSEMDEQAPVAPQAVTPAFKVPALPVGANRALNLLTPPRPTSVGSPGKMLRPRCSMRMNPPKVPLPRGSISRVLEEELGVSCRTRSRRTERSDELSSWVKTAMLLADPELTVRPEEATTLLIAASSTKSLQTFSTYASGLMKSSRERKKIGEGTYGEVFCFTTSRGKTVVKLTPTDGNLIINEAQPKKSLETVMEVLITGVLSDLRDNGQNRCSAFVRLRNIAYLHGNYPRSLLKLWDEFAKEKDTYNERPSKLPKTQRYVSMELAHGGEDLESVYLRDASQGVSVLAQVAAALGVGELAAEFEHRDLHWGNVLLKTLSDREGSSQDEDDSDEEDEDHEEFVLNGERILVENRGVRVTIIDYSLSRMQIPGGPAMFNDLEEDPVLFENYDPDEPQYDVYRDMREVTGCRWEEYHPRTNVLWLLYLCDKLVFRVRYSRTRSDEHKAGMSKLRQYRRKLEKASSANEFVLENMRDRGAGGQENPKK